MAWPSKNPDDYIGRTQWGGTEPTSPPVGFGVTVLLVVVASFGALAATTGKVDLFIAGLAFVPGAVQAAWWVWRRRVHDAA